jgi:5'-deoxynucleotidase YfbR-like HD superfamily hydrolase
MINWCDHFIKAASVKRFHTVPTINNETVGEHSFGVAMMVIAITDRQCSKELLMAALFHDMAEIAIGDTPFNVKVEFPTVKKALADAEMQWESKNNFHIPLTDEEKVVLKYADMLQLLYYCLGQRKLGNTNMDVVFRRGVAYLNELNKFPGKSQDILRWIVLNYQ